MERLRRGVAFRGRAVEEIEVHRPVVDSFAQHVNHAAFADLRRETREELETINVFGIVHVGERELLKGIGLRSNQKCEELWHVERVGTVVVLRRAREVAGATVWSVRFSLQVRRDRSPVGAGHVTHYDCFEALLGDVGGHTTTSSSEGSISSLKSAASSEISSAVSSGNRAAASAHIELSGHDIGYEARAVLAEEFDLAF